MGSEQVRNAGLFGKGSRPEPQPVADSCPGPGVVRPTVRAVFSGPSVDVVCLLALCGVG